MNTCLNCGADTNNPRFCSRSCAAKYNNTKNPKRKTTRTCIDCGGPVSSYRMSRCDVHQEQYKASHYKYKTVGEYRNKLSVKGKHVSWLNAHIRNFARSWLKHLRDEACLKCGYDKHVELAHIKPVSEFPDTALLGEVNSESNIIPLCPNCHWEFDNLPRCDIFTRLVEARGGIEPPVIHPSV